MVTFILWHSEQQQIVWASYSKEICLAKMYDLIRSRQPDFKDGKYYYPYIILDVFVHVKDCLCAQCTGLEDE